MPGFISILPRVLKVLGKIPKEVYIIGGAIALFFFYGNMREREGYKDAERDFELAVATAPSDTVFLTDTLRLEPVIKWRSLKPAKVEELSAQELALINELILEADDLKDLVIEASRPFTVIDTVDASARTIDGSYFKLTFIETLRAQPLDRTIPRTYKFEPIYLRTIGIHTKKIVVGGTSWWKYAGAGLVGVAVGVAITK